MNNEFIPPDAQADIDRVIAYQQDVAAHADAPLEPLPEGADTGETMLATPTRYTERVLRQFFGAEPDDEEGESDEAEDDAEDDEDLDDTSGAETAQLDDQNLAMRLIHNLHPHDGAKKRKKRRAKDTSKNAP